MSLEFQPFPKEVDGIIIRGELTETAGWLPEGQWMPPSDQELVAMKRVERIARIHLDELPARIQLERDNQELS